MTADALVSKEFSRKDLRLWREGDDTANPSSFVYNTRGLFPAPIADAEAESEGGRCVVAERLTYMS